MRIWRAWSYKVLDWVLKTLYRVIGSPFALRIMDLLQSYPRMVGLYEYLNEVADLGRACKNSNAGSATATATSSIALDIAPYTGAAQGYQTSSCASGLKMLGQIVSTLQQFTSYENQSHFFQMWQKMFLELLRTHFYTPQFHKPINLFYLKFPLSDKFGIIYDLS